MRRILLLLLAVFPISAQQPLELTVDTIMRGHGLAGWSPRAVRWAPDGASVFFEWKQYTDAVEKDWDTYVVGRDGKGLRKLSESEAKDAPPARASWSRDRRRAVFVDDGDVFLWDGKRRALTKTTDVESDARFTHDEKSVTFVRGNNLYVLSLADGSVTQRTNIVSAEEKGPHVSLFEDDMKDATASQKWIAEEAKKLSDVVARRAAEKKEDDAERKKEIALAPLKLKKGEAVEDVQLTPDGKFAIAFLSTNGEAGKRTVVPSYVTDTGYTVDLPARRKVGDAAPVTRVVSLSTTDGTANWLKHDLTRPRTEAEKENAEKTEKVESEEVEREIELDPILWSDDGRAALLPIRAADHKDRWLFAFDPATATARVLHHQHDDAWVMWYDEDSAGFVPGTHTVWFVSEHTGWMHLYTVDFAGGTPRALTNGRYEVSGVTAGDKHFTFTASKDSLHELHLYRMPVSGGAITRLTTEPGLHDAKVAPEPSSRQVAKSSRTSRRLDDWTTRPLADVYSYTNKPPELYVGGVRVTTSPAPEFASYAWRDVAIVTFTARDGASVPARLYKPANWSGGPAVIFVHGAGYLQNVHRGWSGYFREYMFHHLLMERGFLVLDVDYRASAGYGRDWRTAIYRHMGGVDLNDHVDAARWLASEHGVDPRRIGIYGGSYGGFITLMAMFTTPDVFAAGAALRPVTDWAHYNHPYTSNILNTPQTDPEAYRKSSPIYFAEGLKGALLICHGMIDVNVHFQDTVRLVQRLIELRKENWEAAMYPLEDHGFVEPTSWADEYKRILRLFERELE